MLQSPVCKFAIFHTFLLQARWELLQCFQNTAGWAWQYAGPLPLQWWAVPRAATPWLLAPTENAVQFMLASRKWAQCVPMNNLLGLPFASSEAMWWLAWKPTCLKWWRKCCLQSFKILGVKWNMLVFCYSLLNNMLVKGIEGWNCPWLFLSKMAKPKKWLGLWKVTVEAALAACVPIAFPTWQKKMVWVLAVISLAMHSWSNTLLQTCLLAGTEWKLGTILAMLLKGKGGNKQLESPTALNHWWSAQSWGICWTQWPNGCMTTCIVFSPMVCWHMRFFICWKLFHAGNLSLTTHNFGRCPKIQWNQYLPNLRQEEAWKG